MGCGWRWGVYVAVLQLEEIKNSRNASVLRSLPNFAGAIKIIHWFPTHCIHHCRSAGHFLGTTVDHFNSGTTLGSPDGPQTNTHVRTTSYQRCSSLQLGMLRYSGQDGMWAIQWAEVKGDA